jgi:uncharacterized membrane-anchored protein
VSAPERSRAAVGLVSALEFARRPDEHGREELTNAAADLVAELMADGAASGVLAVAGLAHTAITYASQVSGHPVEVLLADIARAVEARTGGT